jgi:predicted RNA-binding Zn-ribbon protein involved in translation (DUF1610 family)
MNQANAQGRADEVTLHITSGDLAAGKATLEPELVVHSCARCQLELPDRYHFDCPECGHGQAPISRCRACSGSLRQELVRYVAEGPSGGTATKLLPGVSCLQCGISAVEEQELSELDALADTPGQALFFLPEAGIYTSEMLEVLVDAEVGGAGEPEEVIEQLGDMSLRVGSASGLFDAALSVVTHQDPADIFSPTLLVSPGPPYSAAQRRDLYVLLARVQRELGSPVTCWSASVGLSEEAQVDAVLTEQLMSWQADSDGTALALYYDIVTGAAPGRFQSTFSLLELVLERRLEQDVVQARKDPAVSAEDFALLVQTFSADLGVRLCRRVRAMQHVPLPLLQRLWIAMHPGLSFEEGRVYGAIVAFRDLYAARSLARRSLPLPWEAPDFDGFAQQLRHLISAIIEG